MAQLSGEDVETLYAERPEDFVRARTELARKLKAEGDSEGARQASALRKPTVAAWAINRLARDRPKDVGALLDATEALRRAQRATLTGGGAPKELQEAGQRRRRLVDRLTEAAAGILEKEGMSSARATLDRVSDTLVAMATDEEAAEAVRRGVLERELPAAAGFGDRDDLESALAASVQGQAGAGKAAGRERRSESGASQAEERRLQRAREKADRLAGESAEARSNAEQLEQQAREAERAAARARKLADDARARAERALHRAERAAADARP